MDKENLYFVEVYQYRNRFIVKAKNKAEAKDKVFKVVTAIYPPKEMKEKGYEPYYKKDIETCVKLNEMFDSDGVFEII